MLRVATMPFLATIAGKIDLKPVIGRVKDIDVYDEKEENGVITRKLNKEKLGILGAEIFAELLPQLGSISNELVPLVAAYKGVSEEEAVNMDAIGIILEIVNDKSFVNFFKLLLQKAGKLVS